jgi:hypothetical protein
MFDPKIVVPLSVKGAKRRASVHYLLAPTCNGVPGSFDEPLGHGQPERTERDLTLRDLARSDCHLWPSLRAADQRCASVDRGGCNVIRSRRPDGWNGGI